MLKLTDQEKQEILRYLEANKELPEKFRFLLFEDKREVELVWNGKTNEVCNLVLPFQTIEQVDEPRAEKSEESSVQEDLFTTDARGRQLKGWTNKLIWGNNKLILSSLKNGPLREEIEKAAEVKGIPFDERRVVLKEQVAAFFEVDIRTINNYLERYSAELRVFDSQALLNLAMLMTESECHAKKGRQRLKGHKSCVSSVAFVTLRRCAA